VGLDRQTIQLRFLFPIRWPKPNMDDLVAADMMRLLRDEIPKSFNAADKRLRRDDKKYRATKQA
jgi:hypothetical protein